MKIAIPTDDGEHISEAFGHARYFFIMDLKTGKAQLRDNVQDDLQGKGHSRAVLIAEILNDVDVIVTSHMGKPMIDKMLSEGKIIYISPKALKISDVLNLYFEGALKKMNINKMIN